MMEWRNPQFNAAGGIDCEIEHPQHGWIPFTAKEDDPAGAEIFAAAFDTALPAPAPDPAAEWAAAKDRARRAVQDHIDTTAQERQYDSGVNCASYAGSSITLWRDEAAAFIAWRDAVWAQIFATLAQVEAGTAAPPESEAALIATLPPMVWPGPA